MKLGERSRLILARERVGRRTESDQTGPQLLNKASTPLKANHEIHRKIYSKHMIVLELLPLSPMSE